MRQQRANESRKRRSWLDGFMAYPQPSGVGEAVWREHIMLLDQILYGLWNLGDNLIYAWMPIARGLRVLVAPHPLLTEFAQGDGIQPPGEVIRRTRLLDKLLSTNDPLDEAQFDAVAEALGVTPRTVELPFSPEHGLGLQLIAAIVARYGIRLVEDRAVILFDAVGFSLLTPLQQVVQLNSLSCSVNAAYARLLDREININFARTTTGDGFYIWNRMRGLEANIELYQLMQLILADNALARERSAEPRTVPRLRACFHVGSHYEFYQSEGLNPTSFSYLVGQVTIELARMIDKALPGQILVGKFDTVMRDDVSGDEVRIDSLDFVDRARAPLRRLNGLNLAGSEVEEIACYLTGRRDQRGLWGISEFTIADKHGLPHRVYNAKINIHRRNGDPIYLGLREEDLPPAAHRITAETDFSALT
ncbi:hypothetical protein [Roseateles paludis]|uniref:Uncharacterized protein n=1 Tax=Roseateles paludis TaxID=3145238 RepID=A0ABV0FY48_9BURK